MAGKPKRQGGFGKKLNEQQKDNKTLYSISGGVPSQASNSIISGGSQGGGTAVNVMDHDIYMNTYDIVDVDRLKFATKEGAGDALTADDYGMEALYTSGTAYGLGIRYPAGISNIFQIVKGSSEILNISDAFGMMLQMPIVIEDAFLQMGNQPTPATPSAGYRKIFVDEDNSDHLTVLKSDGSEVDLESGGTWVGTATSDLDMDTWDIIDVDRLQFTKDSGAGRTNSKVEMYASGNTPEDAIINHPEDSYFRFTENGQQYLTISNNSQDGIMPVSSGDMSLGSATKLWGGINTEQITVYGGGSGINGTQIGLNLQTSGGQVGVNCGGTGYAFTSIWNGIEDLGRSNNYWNDLYTKEINLKEKLTIADTSANPTTNGQFTRNGNDVKVYTGGGVKNLSDIGSGGGGWDGDATSNLDMNGYQIQSAGQIDCTALTSSGAIYGSSTLTVNNTTYLNGNVNLGNSSGDDIDLEGKLDVRSNYTSSTVNFYSLYSQGYITIKVGGSNKRLYYFAG
jgi:hypothetical protein